MTFGHEELFLECKVMDKDDRKIKAGLWQQHNHWEEREHHLCAMEFTYLPNRPAFASKFQYLLALFCYLHNYLISLQLCLLIWCLQDSVINYFLLLPGKKGWTFSSDHECTSVKPWWILPLVKSQLIS